MSVLSVSDWSVEFKEKKKTLYAIHHISFEIKKNTTVGLVGESGSGKSLTALSLLQLLPPEAKSSGKIMWNQERLDTKSSAQMQKIRGKDIALIFQNPQLALNPVYTIGNQLIETIQFHHHLSTSDATDKAIWFLKKVGIPDPAGRLNHYPHQLSLGMCQRVMIALTLSMQPKLLIADEPTASLDVTVQAQILQLIRSLQEEFEMSVLLISHDLGVIAQSCDLILVMYLGRLVEIGNRDTLFKHPKHPYTQALIQAIPRLDGTLSPSLQGDPPSPYDLPSGCAFHPRCPYAMYMCRQQAPPMRSVDESSQVACFLV